MGGDRCGPIRPLASWSPDCGVSVAYLIAAVQETGDRCHPDEREGNTGWPRPRAKGNDFDIVHVWLDCPRG